MSNWFLIIVSLLATGEVQTVTAGPFTSERACQITAATAEFEPYAPKAVKTVSECVKVENWRGVVEQNNG